MKKSFSSLLAAMTILLTSVSALAQDPSALNAPNGVQQADGQQAAQQPAQEANQADTSVRLSNGSQEGIFSGFMDPFDYDPRGRRDPFLQPIPDKPVEQGNVAGPLLPLQKFELGQLRREGEMVVVETTDQDGRLVSSAQVVKIAK
ncbi:MAG: hypothetical protein EOP05_09175 [Proteobacteria bacterium]|nr:MAG: hypothetical protein EOP05_09175 [Pseudomonadota bacterium]